MSSSNLLTPALKIAILEGRISGWAEAVYDQEVIRDGVLAKNPDADVSGASDIIADLEAAIAKAQQSLIAIEEASVPGPTG